MDKELQAQIDIMQRGLETVPLDELTPKIKAVLKLKDSPLNSSQVIITLHTVAIEALNEVLEKTADGPEKEQIANMVKTCNDMILQLAYSLGIHNDPSSIPRLTEKH